MINMEWISATYYCIQVEDKMGKLSSINCDKKSDKPVLDCDIIFWTSNNERKVGYKCINGGSLKWYFEKWIKYINIYI